MSYEIVYNKAFIKTSRGIIPLLLTGSNNCYEYHLGRERRERRWTCFYGNKHFEISEQDLLGFYEQKKSDKDNYEFCMYRGKWVYYHDAYEFIKNGVKNAHTLEEWLQHGKYGKYGTLCNLYCHISDWTNHSYKRTHEKTITTTADLEAWLDDVKTYIGDKKDLYICIEWGVNEAITYNAPAIIKGLCIIQYKRGVYVSDLRTLTRNKKDAKIFNSAQEAGAYLSQNCLSKYNYKIINYNPHAKTPLKNCFIRIVENGYCKGFYARFSKYGYRYTYTLCDANKMTEKRANDVIEQLNAMKKYEHFKNYQFDLVKEGNL